MDTQRSETRILVSNDDGIAAAGLRSLAEGVSALGEVVVVAPDKEQSATSHSLTLWHPLRLTEQAPGWYASDGGPADCVNLGVFWVMRERKPDIVLSGINHGANLGEDLFYSGTVSAAREAAILGIPAIALSLCGRGHFHFETAAKWALRITKQVLSHRLPKGIFLNVNIPNVKPEEVTGIEVTRQGTRNYGAGIIEKKDPRGRAYYWISGTNPEYSNEPGTDAFAIHEKRVSITPIHLDTTHYPTCEILAHWKFEEDR